MPNHTPVAKVFVQSKPPPNALPAPAGRPCSTLLGAAWPDTASQTKATSRRSPRPYAIWASDRGSKMRAMSSLQWPLPLCAMWRPQHGVRSAHLA